MKKTLIKIILPLFVLSLNGCQNSGQHTTFVPPTTSYTHEVYPITIKMAESLTMDLGTSTTLTLNYYPLETTIKEATWISSDPKIATVDNGTINALKVGKCNIIAKAIDKDQEEISSICKLTVIDPNCSTKTILDYTYNDYYEKNAYTNYDNCPTKGNPKLLIVPIWFNDSNNFIAEANKEKVRDDIRKAFVGSNTEAGWRSVTTFYAEESFNKLNITATITDWYNVDYSYKAYGDTTNGKSLIKTLVTTASNRYFIDNPTDSKSNYDIDRDGILDGVVFIYAAPDYKSLKTNLSNLWAFCSHIQPREIDINNPTVDEYLWASYDFMYSSDKASSRTGKSSYAHGDTKHCSIDTHTFIHEIGHILGLKDYYDYSESAFVPAAGFSMQDYNVGGHDPYSLMAFGWADPYIPYNTVTLTIGDFQSTHDIVLLANHMIDSPFDEYLLVELYTPTGLNKFDTDYKYLGNLANYPMGVNAPGIRVWHVDARLTTYNHTTKRWENLITDPNFGNVYHAMSNSYDGDHGSCLGSSYYDYNILQLIRNNTTDDYRPKSFFDSSSMFYKGGTFDLATYSKQFVGGTKMNDGKALGWSFKINDLSSGSATITFTKA